MKLRLFCSSSLHALAGCCSCFTTGWSPWSLRPWLRATACLSSANPPFQLTRRCPSSSTPSRRCSAHAATSLDRSTPGVTGSETLLQHSSRPRWTCTRRCATTWTRLACFARCWYDSVCAACLAAFALSLMCIPRGLSGLAMRMSTRQRRKAHHACCWCRERHATWLASCSLWGALGAVKPQRPTQTTPPVGKSCWRLRWMRSCRSGTRHTLHAASAGAHLQTFIHPQRCDSRVGSCRLFSARAACGL